MGLTDVFSKEDRIEITVSQFHDLMKESVKGELIINGLEAEVSAEDLMSIFAPERKQDMQFTTIDDFADENELNKCPQI